MNSDDKMGTLATTEDGGKTWFAPGTLPGYRSAVTYVPEKKMWIAAGINGTDVSLDNGKTWRQLDKGMYNAMSFSGGAGWAVGPAGVIAKLN